MAPTSFLHRVLLGSKLAHLPIRLFSGPLRGLWWTLYPNTAYWRGAHEPDLTRWLLAQQLTGAVAWDIGAHFGYYSALLARTIGQNGTVFAFEPNPFNFAKLRRHAALNPRLRIQPHAVAVGAHTGEVILYSYNGGFDSSGHLPYPGETVEQAPYSWTVPLLRLDEAVAAGRVAKPAFIKLDVEGHGAHALSGAQTTIAHTRPIILAGLHTLAESEGIDHILRPLQYRKITVHGQAALYTGGQMDVVYLPTDSTS